MWQMALWMPICAILSCRHDAPTEVHAAQVATVPWYEHSRWLNQQQTLSRSLQERLDLLAIRAVLLPPPGRAKLSEQLGHLQVDADRAALLLDRARDTTAIEWPSLQTDTEQSLGRLRDDVQTVQNSLPPQTRVEAQLAVQHLSWAGRADLAEVARVRLVSLDRRLQRLSPTQAMPKQGEDTQLAQLRDTARANLTGAADVDSDHWELWKASIRSQLDRFEDAVVDAEQAPQSRLQPR